MHDSFCAHSFSTFALIPAGAIKVHWRNRTIMIFYYTRFCHWRQKSLQIATDDPDYNHNTSGFGDQNHCLKHRLNMGDATMQSSRFSTGGSLLGAGGAGQSVLMNNRLRRIGIGEVGGERKSLRYML